MTRIVLVHPRPTRGGFSAVVAQARELVAIGGHQIHVVVSAGHRTSELPPTVVLHTQRYPLRSVRGAQELRGLLARLEPGLVHFHGRQAGLVGRLVMRRSSRACVLYTPHGTPWVASSWSRAVLGDAMERLLLRRTDHVLCVSRAEQSEWLRRDQSVKIKYFPNAVDLRSADVPHDADRPYERTILVPSGYHPQKRVEVVIEALALLTVPRPRVTVCGAVDDRRYLEGLVLLAERLGVRDDVEFASELPCVRQRMASAGLVVLPSFSEGMPIVGQEAVVAGARVAWSAIPPHLELFTDHGRPFWTADELAEIMTADWDPLSTAQRLSGLRREQEKVERDRASLWRSLSGSPCS